MKSRKHTRPIVSHGISLGLILWTTACGFTPPDGEVAVSPERTAAEASAVACSWAGSWATKLTTDIGTYDVTIGLKEQDNTVSGDFALGTDAQVSLTGALSSDRSSMKGTWKATGNPSAPNPLKCEGGDLSLTIAADCKTASGKWWCGPMMGEPRATFTAVRQ